MTTAELFACFGDVIELDFASWNVQEVQSVLDNHTGWKQYNPRKPNNRFGLSVTSLDGGYSGVPDLDSLLEYNKINGTIYTEIDFNVRTDLVEQLADLKMLVNSFYPSLGRCHFLRLNAGGFFPPHRDNGPSIPSQSFRVIVPLGNTSPKEWHWIQEGKLLNLISGKAYAINTTKEHSVFSFVDNCCMLVLNVLASNQSLNAVTKHLGVR